MILYIFIQTEVYMLISKINKGKNKVLPLQAWTNPSGSRRLRLLEFLDNQHMKVLRLSGLYTGRLYPSGYIPGTHFC
jgi:hypothetical protein